MRFIPAVTWLITMTVLFLLPGTEFPQETWFEKIYLDKWLHAAFFFLLVYLFYLPLNVPKNKWLPTLVISGMAYGLLIEIAQKYWVKDRSFDWADILFDGLGCLIAYGYLRTRAKK